MDTEKKIGASGWSDESDFPGFFFIFGIDAESSEIQIATTNSTKLGRTSEKIRRNRRLTRECRNRRGIV